MTPAAQLVADLRFHGYRAEIRRYRGQAEIVVEGQAGRLSANAPRPLSAAIPISTDGQHIGRLVGTGASAEDDVTANGETAIRNILF